MTLMIFENVLSVLTFFGYVWEFST